MLTAGIDNKTGGAGSDHFIADNTINTQLNAGDQLDGGAGADTLTLYTGNLTAPGTATLPTGMKNIETLEVVHDDSDDLTVNAGNAVGLETIKLTSTATSNDITINTKGNATSVTVTGGDDVVIGDTAATDTLASVTIDGSKLTAAAAITSDALTSLTIKDAAANATVTAAAGARTLNLTLNSASTGTITDAQATTLNVTTTGKASTGVTLTAASATSLTINADEALTVTDVNIAAAKTIAVKGDSAVTISATTTVTALESVSSVDSTGGVTITPTLAAGVTFTGGSGADAIELGASTTTNTLGDGADTLTLTGSALGTKGSVSGGTGRDTLKMTGTNAATATASDAVTDFSGKVIDFEILSLSTVTNNTIDVGNLNKNNWNAIDTVVLDDASAAVVQGLVNSSTVQVTKTGQTTGALTANLATGATTLNLKLGAGTTTSAAAGIKTGLTTNATTLNIQTNAGPTATAGANRTSVIDAFTATNLTNINLTGTAVELTNAATTKAVTIDGSQLTGDGGTGSPAVIKGLTVGGNLVAGSTVTGSDYVDTFNLGTVGSSYNGGKGDDVFVAANLAQLRSGATYNKIDGGAGDNSLIVTVGGGITMVDDDFKELKNIKTIGLNSTANTIDVTTGGWYDASFKSAGVNVEIAATTGAVTFTGGTFSGDQGLKVTSSSTTNAIDLLTGSGNDTIAVTNSAAMTAGNITVDAGEGNNSVTVTADALTTADISLVTGTGTDTVTVSAKGLTSGDLDISTGAGNDTISITVANTITTGTLTVNAGAGTDSITFTGVDAADRGNVSITISAGESTLTGYDIITGYGVTNTGINIGMTLDFDGSADKAADVLAGAVAGYNSAELTYTIASGLLTFTGTSASGLTAAQKADIAQLVVTAANATVVFTAGSDSWVFHNDAAGDSLVKLVGVAAAGLDASATTANFVTVG